jgi:hypothetical protein
MSRSKVSGLPGQVLRQNLHDATRLCANPPVRDSDIWTRRPATSPSGFYKNCQNPIDKSADALVRNVTRAGFPAELKQRGGAGQGCSAALRHGYKRPDG